MQANGNAVITWPSVIGRLYKVQESTNMTTWTDSTGNLFAATTTGSFTDVLPARRHVLSHHRDHSVRRANVE